MQDAEECAALDDNDGGFELDPEGSDNRDCSTKSDTQDDGHAQVAASLPGPLLRLSSRRAPAQPAPDGEQCPPRSSTAAAVAATAAVLPLFATT